MSWLPGVAESTRERVSREFDEIGPEACVAEIAQHLSSHNPEILDMAAKCARDVGEPGQAMVGFGMFYRLLLAQSRGAGPGMQAAPLPRVTPQTRGQLAGRIADKGAARFTRQALEQLERDNPQLLQMAHRFASRQPDYLGTMQGFALLYAALAAQAQADRAQPH